MGDAHSCSELVFYIALFFKTESLSVSLFQPYFFASLPLWSNIRLIEGGDDPSGFPNIVLLLNEQTECLM